MAKNYYGVFALLVPFTILLIAILFNVTRPYPVRQMQVVQGGDAGKAPAAIVEYGCGTCHVIAGVYGANGVVGPALNDLATRSFIAGKLRNTPENLIQWIRFPQEVSPGVDMPDLGVTESAARDIAAYLYLLN